MDKIDILTGFDEKYFDKYIKSRSIDVEISYLSAFNSAKKIRDIINNICSILNIDVKNTSRIILIIDEMNNNAIEYGSKKGDVNLLRFKAERNENEINLNIEVEDSGKGKKPKKSLDMETLRVHQLKLGYLKHDSIRGRGLFMIIVNLVDRLYFKDAQSGGLIVGIKKKLKI